MLRIIEETQKKLIWSLNNANNGRKKLYMCTIMVNVRNYKIASIVMDGRNTVTTLKYIKRNNVLKTVNSKTIVICTTMKMRKGILFVNF